MAFFSDGKQNYFSLSLNPTHKDRVYVFRITRGQFSIAYWCLPIFLIFALLLLAGTISVAVGNHWVIDAFDINRENQEPILRILSTAATAFVFFEVIFFLWIRRTRLSLLNEEDRKKLGSMKIYKEISSCVYANVLFCLLSPFFSVLSLPERLGEATGENWTAGFGGPISISVYIIISMLALFLIYRTVQIFLLPIKK
jgi:hypothetical protein